MTEEIAAGGVPEGSTGTNTEPGEIAPPAVCATCGTPYVWKRKWNSGNPADILMSCDCEDDDPPPLRAPCPECNGRGWRINPDYFGGDADRQAETMRPDIVTLNGSVFDVLNQVADAEEGDR